MIDAVMTSFAELDSTREAPCPTDRGTLLHYLHERPESNAILIDSGGRRWAIWAEDARLDGFRVRALTDRGPGRGGLTADTAIDHALRGSPPTHSP